MALLNLAPKFDPNKNDYYTGKIMWKNITHLIPKDKIIWEACMLNSKSNSIEYWKELGYNCIGNTEWNCLDYEPDNYDYIITNPPFKTDLKIQIIKKFIEYDKPFILVLNIMNAFTNYFRTIFGDKIKDLQIIIPQGKITFEEFNQETKKIEKCKSSPSFYCFYLAYKMNLPTEQLWLKK